MRTQAGPVAGASTTPVINGSPQLMRRMNRVQVLSVLRGVGPMSRPMISKATGLSKVTIDAVVGDLMGAGLVVERADVPGNGPGRPARWVSFRENARHVLGVDIGATKVLIGVGDLSGELSDRARIDTRNVRAADQLLDLIRDGLLDAARRNGLAPQDVGAVCIGTPGVVDPVTKTVRLAPQLPGWEDLPLGQELDVFEGSTVLVENEVHLAVMAERWRGAAQGEDDVAYVHLGVGVGLGVLIGGQLLRGAHGGAGEIGYLPLAGNDARHPPDRYEERAGAAAYARRAREMVTAGRGAELVELAGGNGEALDAQVVYRAAAAGDVDAIEVIEEILTSTALGIASIVATLDPALVIVGGGVSQAGQPMLSRLETKVSDLVPITPRFALARLGGQAVLIGAVHRAIETCLEEMFQLV